MAGLPSNIAQVTSADPYLGPIMSELLMCLCEKAALAPNPPAHCAFRIGTQVPHDLGIDGDLCCEGLAYVTMGDLFPSVNFPSPDTQRMADAVCPPVSWGVNLTASLVRCIPTAGETVITDDDWNASALQGVYDARTLLNTACCFRDYLNSSPLFNGYWSVIGNVVLSNAPLGGCIERSISFQVQTPNCC